MFSFGQSHPPNMDNSYNFFKRQKRRCYRHGRERFKKREGLQKCWMGGGRHKKFNRKRISEFKIFVILKKLVKNTVDENVPKNTPHPRPHLTERKHFFRREVFPYTITQSWLLHEQIKVFMPKSHICDIAKMILELLQKFICFDNLTHPLVWVFG